jgi:hypothetical protein
LNFRVSLLVRRAHSPELQEGCLLAQPTCQEVVDVDMLERVV